MLLKRIIPCLDVDKGRVVKGVKYVDHVDAGDPVEVAQMYDAQEADEITPGIGRPAARQRPIFFASQDERCS